MKISFARTGLVSTKLKVSRNYLIIRFSKLIESKIKFFFLAEFSEILGLRTFKHFVSFILFLTCGRFGAAAINTTGLPFYPTIINRAGGSANINVDINVDNSGCDTE